MITPYKGYIGVKKDGPRRCISFFHEKYEKYHRGRETYTRTRVNLKALPTPGRVGGMCLTIVEPLPPVWYLNGRVRGKPQPETGFGVKLPSTVPIGTGRRRCESVPRPLTCFPFRKYLSSSTRVTLSTLSLHLIQRRSSPTPRQHGMG